MTNIENIKILLSDHLPDLQKRFPIAHLALFGSVLRDDFNEESDIDILIEFNGPIGIEFIDLVDDLEKLLNRKVDLITKEGLKTRQWDYLKSRVQYV